MDSQITLMIRSLAAEPPFGAARIAEVAADILLRRAELGEASSPDTFREEILQTGLAIIQAQPSLAPLVNLLSDVLWNLEHTERPGEQRLAVREATEDFKRQLRQQAIHVAEGSLAFIEDGSIIVTHSLSTTVQYALLHAQRAGRRFHVICSESRPMLEGRQTARELAESGIGTTVMVDTLTLESVYQARAVVVGADMLNSHGLVNKVGTRALAMVAQAVHVPFYALCGSVKFLPTAFQPNTNAPPNTSEVWDEPPQGVTVTHWDRDLTPLGLISGIVTERGTLPPIMVEGWLAAMHLHPSLINMRSHSLLT